MLQPFDDKTGGQQGTVRPPRRRRNWAGYLGPVLAIGLIVYAGIVLYGMATRIDPREIGIALENIPAWRILVAVALTVISVVSLAAYDVCAIKVVRTRKPVGTAYAALCGGIANIFANGLGFPILTGGMARYRLYSMIGLDLAAVGRIMALTWVTMWSGLVFVLGLTLLLGDTGEEAVFLNHTADRTIGAVLLLVLTIAVLWTGRRRRAVRLGGWAVRLPTTPVLIAMIAAGGVDLFASAATLYVLLPPDVVPSMAIYMITYVVAILAGNAANTPGGLGVFEAAMVTGLELGDRPDVAASLILFRIIYFLLPLAVSIGLFGVMEWRFRRARAAAGPDES
ncbi:UPF0104 family protein [Methylobrevis pamukkalensis]|uniref:Inner membrane protein YbhN n=1 Tax=Methylobrevis pamukkalensis TaxID=1439726 RepID=A0A1E3GX21_9HYPH|nr:UPF0104 family protein [Methylobrevis pamukkalensis]ODN68602.1 Inner membrane protein YbhN [Methylobrevis pamukkalensis]